MDLIFMMAFFTCLKAIFLLQAARLVLGNIEVRRLDNKTFEGFECISKKDITIQFINHTSNGTQTFAECSTDLKGCYLTEQSFGNKYAVFYTGRGGTIYINTFVDKSHGSYRCCEKYESRLCSSMQFVTENTRGNNSDWDIQKHLNISSDPTAKQSREDYAFRVGISTTLFVSIVINVTLVCLQVRKKGLITRESLMCRICKRKSKKNRSSSLGSRELGLQRPMFENESESWVIVRPASTDFSFMVKKSDIRGTPMDRCSTCPIKILTEGDEADELYLSNK